MPDTKSARGKPRRKAPKNTEWRGDSLYGRIHVKGKLHRWTLRTSDVELARVRVAEDIARLKASAFYGDSRVKYEDIAASWAEDHPMRHGAKVYRDDEIPPGSFLIASTLGDKRTPPAEGEHEVIGACARCRCPIVWRSSAPATLTPICIPCWARL